jgi:hypothetical protein
LRWSFVPPISFVLNSGSSIAGRRYEPQCPFVTLEPSARQRADRKVGNDTSYYRRKAPANNPFGTQARAKGKRRLSHVVFTAFCRGTSRISSIAKGIAIDSVNSHRRASIGYKQRVKCKQAVNRIEQRLVGSVSDHDLKH